MRPGEPKAKDISERDVFAKDRTKSVKIAISPWKNTRTAA
jgi:hypothetical protein